MNLLNLIIFLNHHLLLIHLLTLTLIIYIQLNNNLNIVNSLIYGHFFINIILKLCFYFNYKFRIDIQKYFYEILKIAILMTLNLFEISI